MKAAKKWGRGDEVVWIMRKHMYGISNLICPVCGNIFPIPRLLKRQRKKGHIKTIWCPFCKEMRDFIEQGIQNKIGGIT